jgi:putative addiction module killer protein
VFTLDLIRFRFKSKENLAKSIQSATINFMYTIKPLPEFDAWLNGLKDRATRIRLIKRLARVAAGNLGDVKSVGDGVFEMREFFGPGWRMYYVQQGKVLIIMLGGGEKATQQSDIEISKKLALQLLMPKEAQE